HEAVGRREAGPGVAEELVPQADAAPRRHLARRLAFRRLDRYPGLCAARTEAPGQRVGIIEAHHRRRVARAAQRGVLVDQLPLRLDHPAVVELERIAALDRGGEAEAVGLQAQ